MSRKEIFDRIISEGAVAVIRMSESCSSMLRFREVIFASIDKDLLN